ncbi:MAG: hypothetical protein OXC46_08425, partial [Thaumarchaeota archaeon]|nr:hypothetical protein [Nitrososphaerota archaeon]
VRKAMWSIIKARPYVLRAYFDTQLLLAESHGKMTHAYRQFFMGHKGDIEARYTTNKGRLTDEMSSDMRRSFSQSEAFISTGTNNTPQQDKKEMLLEMWREQAKMHGLDHLKIKIEKQRSNGAELTGFEEVDTIRGAILASQGTEDLPYNGKIVYDENQLIHHVCNGWEPVQELDGGRFLIRRKKD